MAKENPYLDVQHLTKSFGSLVLFHDISFSVAEGQKVGLIAKNVNRWKYSGYQFFLAKRDMIAVRLSSVGICACGYAWSRLQTLIPLRVFLMRALIIKATQRRC